MLSKQFITGGNATFTVQSKTGEYRTFKVRQPRPEMPYFVSLLTGPCNESAYTYMGILTPDKPEMVRLTAKSKVTEDSLAVKIVRWALRQVWDGKTLPEGYQIRHEGKCGCCGRKLTTPESLDRGIGPECAKRFGW
jgi:hypothetical protein